MKLNHNSYRIPALLVVVILLVLAASTASFAQGRDRDLSNLTAGGSLTVSEEISASAQAKPETLQGGGWNQPSTSGAFTSTGLQPVSIIVTFDGPVDDAQLASAADGQIVYRYSEVFNGVSMVLPGGKVESVATFPNVSGVYLDQLLQLDTEVSPQFIGADVAWNALGGQDDAGEGVVVGILDSGIWPEHPSVSDPDPAGNAYDPPAVAPGSNGFGAGGPRSTCDFGNSAYNPDDAAFTCNNKLIAAYSFLDTYKLAAGLLPEEFDSARDDNGHGTHTMTTAAGNGGVMATLLGVDRGLVSGVSPRSHVIAYRVCGDAGCYTSDSVAAVEQAILDEVDVINFSISGGNNPFSDAVELAFAAAYDNGVFVAASAGNSGPTANTVAHRSPWVTTVAASTSDRHFLATLSLAADNSDTLDLVGATVTDGISTPTAVVYPPAGEELCLDEFAPGTFNGEIVICERGVNARVLKSYNVSQGGAAGMILYNPALQGLNTDNHFIPSVHVDGPEGVQLNDFMSTHSGVTATFTGGTASAVPGDVIASFSSRGGTGQVLGINKPDITAPGVQILAGMTPLPATPTGGLPGQLFQAIQGTSMSSPHIAGSAALVAAMNPTWTPGQIKSAIMLTAETDVLKEDGVTAANAYDTGSGRVDMARAGDSPLTIDESVADYFLYADELWEANYPSLYMPNLYGTLTVERTVHNETNLKRNWKLTVDAPADLIVTVPKHVSVPANGDATFAITVSAPTVPVGEVRFATLELKQGNQRLNFPITIVRGEASVAIDKACDPASIKRNQTTSCTITLTNNGGSDAAVSLVDQLPSQLKLIPASVVGGVAGNKKVTFNGTLFGAGAPVVDVADSTYTSFLSMSSFVAPLPCPANCDDGAFNFSGLDFYYLGQHYTSAILSVNGTLEPGSASGLATSAANVALPNPGVPNNLLAPWWTDLDLTGAGDWYAASLTGGGLNFSVFSWENVPRYGDPGSTFSFQIWIIDGTDIIWYSYGAAAGDTSDATVGAENSDGTVGDTYYFNGAGTVPFVAGTDLDILSVAGTPGQTHVITFDAKGDKLGKYTNCAVMTADTFDGTAIDCFSGIVTR